ncbi:hypothetical protein E2C01_055969 [Portunus trituberculatus]|uniref:Uncharacterized protein n=1 Tax=Portunus trituberculatus TaxID=210409 RepID=A0A5B7GSU7_PORTR|nr:hypothetical protein [Portunus trituberculatus]
MNQGRRLPKKEEHNHTARTPAVNCRVLLIRSAAAPLWSSAVSPPGAGALPTSYSSTLSFKISSFNQNDSTEKTAI